MANLTRAALGWKNLTATLCVLHQREANKIFLLKLSWKSLGRSHLFQENIYILSRLWHSLLTRMFAEKKTWKREVGLAFSIKRPGICHRQTDSIVCLTWECGHLLDKVWQQDFVRGRRAQNLCTFFLTLSQRLGGWSFWDWWEWFDEHHPNKREKLRLVNAGDWQQTHHSMRKQFLLDCWRDGEAGAKPGSFQGKSRVISLGFDCSSLVWKSQSERHDLVTRNYIKTHCGFYCFCTAWETNVG